MKTLEFARLLRENRLVLVIGEEFSTVSLEPNGFFVPTFGIAAYESEVDFGDGFVGIPFDEDEFGPREDSLVFF